MRSNTFCLQKKLRQPYTKGKKTIKQKKKICQLYKQQASPSAKGQIYQIYEVYRFCKNPDRQKRSHTTDFIPKRKEVYAKIWSRGGNLIQETCCSIVPRGTLAGWGQEENIFGGYYITYLPATHSSAILVGFIFGGYCISISTASKTLQF